jgi:hypothetical protein
MSFEPEPERKKQKTTGGSDGDANDAPEFRLYRADVDGSPQEHGGRSAGSGPTNLARQLRLSALPETHYTAGGLVGVSFEQTVVVPPEDQRVLFSAEACDCVILAVRVGDGTRLMAHKQLDRGPIGAFVTSLLSCVPSQLQHAEFVIVGGHDDTLDHVNMLISTISLMTRQHWKLTHQQLFGCGVTRSLAMLPTVARQGTCQSKQQSLRTRSDVIQRCEVAVGLLGLLRQ